MIVRASMTVKCDTCGVEHTFAGEGPQYIQSPDTDGWVLTEAADTCPSCMRILNEKRGWV